MPRQVIDRFEGEYRFLSNFSNEGGIVPTLEHWYQAGKAENEGDMDKILAASTPAEAKRLGRKIKMSPESLKEWDRTKINYMRILLYEKFKEPTIRAKLIATGNAELIEGNSWHDNFWGMYDDSGLNWLGKLLEEVRLWYRSINE